MTTRLPPLQATVRIALTLGLAVALSGGLAACGRKAPNKFVEGGAYPRSYPAPTHPAPPGTQTVPKRETPEQQRERTAQPPLTL